MKGVVFTEFLDMIENKFGLELVDRLIESSDLQSGGSYTSVGTYDYQELIQLVVKLGKETSTPVPALVQAFGSHLFERFTTSYPFALQGVDDAAGFLANVEDIIHAEVKKLYPDAELPTIDFRRTVDNDWQLIYRSTRPFADLCEGLIRACLEYFEDHGELIRQDMDTSDASFAASFFFKAKIGAKKCQIPVS